MRPVHLLLFGVGVVLTPGEGGITTERVYYDAASLTRCGWVR